MERNLLSQKHTPSSQRILVVFGTRPEAIKMAPVVKALKRNRSIETYVCVTGQHREMLTQVLELFQIHADFDLEVMQINQSLSTLTCKILDGVGHVIDQIKPTLVMVHGDTTTAFASALAAFYRQVEVAHVEAGLRTNQLYSPWPEEANRRLVGTLATWHFTPTSTTEENLLRENISPKNIHVTGNTVIDALLQTVSAIHSNPVLEDDLEQKFSFLNPSKKMILVTAHRRENHGAGMLQICEALKRLAARKDVEIVYPVHPNPNVAEPVRQLLGNIPSIHLIEPQEYISFVYLMDRSFLILTDSGGIQEEAPSLRKPVLVLRETTERPEALEAGTILLTGTNVHRIVNAVETLLTDFSAYQKMASAKNPYGDGKAAQKILNALHLESESVAHALV